MRLQHVFISYMSDVTPQTVKATVIDDQPKIMRRCLNLMGNGRTINHSTELNRTFSPMRPRTPSLRHPLHLSCPVLIYVSVQAYLSLHHIQLQPFSSAHPNPAQPPLPTLKPNACPTNAYGAMWRRRSLLHDGRQTPGKQSPENVNRIS